MSRLPPLAGPDPHSDIQALLPWLANGSLAGAELERVQLHLRACPACRAQLEWERSLRAGGQPAPPLSARRAFAALGPRLGAQDAGTPGVVQPGCQAALAAANDPRWLRAAAALQLGVIVVLGLLLARPVERGDAGYHTLGARPAVTGSIVVGFAPATPERELRRILQASGARIVDGPTASDAYVLAVAPGQAAPALRRLRTEAAVTLAEPLSAEGAP